MPFKLSIEVDGQKELDVALTRAADSVSDLSKYWPAVADVFYDIERQQFRTEGARAGARWAPLSPRYAAWKANRSWDPLLNKILVLEGPLKSSLTTRGDANGIYEPEPLALTLGSTLPYALAHQRGDPGRNLPARPPIHMLVEDAKRFRRAFSGQIRTVVRRTWVQEDFEDFDPRYDDVTEDGLNMVRSSMGNEGMVEFPGL